ncbi:MAG: RES family NAD+ phosphorylase [Gammaproteobacteria bacterium]|nr:RES family NAD+ phosphorylase [Gammaproteobacteria bacterium]
MLGEAEAKTASRVRDGAGSAKLIPDDRRVSGPGADLAMAPFCHFSPERPSRFSDGSFGVCYAGDRFEVALAETVFHFERFMKATAEEPALMSYRELILQVDAQLHDLRDNPEIQSTLDPDDYAVAQTLARELRQNHASEGIVYPSVRYPEGEAVAAFWPDVLGIPAQGRHLCYRWNGSRVDAWLLYGEDGWRYFG